MCLILCSNLRFLNLDNIIIPSVITLWWHCLNQKEFYECLVPLQIGLWWHIMIMFTLCALSRKHACEVGCTFTYDCPSTCSFVASHHRTVQTVCEVPGNVWCEDMCACCHRECVIKSFIPLTGTSHQTKASENQRNIWCRSDEWTFLCHMLYAVWKWRSVHYWFLWVVSPPDFRPVC